jgi:hypothetical protein
MTTESAFLIWLVGALIGSMLFFAITVAPTVFRALPADNAGAFLRAFFPHYYLWGLVVALTTATLAFNSNAVVSVVCFLVALLFVFSRQILMPLINRERDAELQGVTGAAKRFNLLHRWSVLINIAQIAILFGVAALLILEI